MMLKRLQNGLLNIRSVYKTEKLINYTSILKRGAYFMSFASETKKELTQIEADDTMLKSRSLCFYPNERILYHLLIDN